MADMIVSSLHTPEAEQSSAGIAPEQEQAATPVVIEAPLAKEPAAPIDLDPNAPTTTAVPVEAIEPAQQGGQPAARPAAQPGQSSPEEDELDELIIEDFTIDGICGVY